jgi:hypothetical protein
MRDLERKRREAEASNASDHGEEGLLKPPVGEKREIIGMPPPMKATGRTE